MSQAKRYREDYQRQQQSRELDEMRWFEKNLDRIDQKRRARSERFVFFGGGMFSLLLLLIWVIVRSKWLLIDIHPLGLVVIGAVLSFLGVRFGRIVEKMTRK